MNDEAIRQRRLRWKCRRGMLELDIILRSFFEEHYDSLKENQKQTFARLLECEDTELWAWLMQNQQPENHELAALIEKINLQNLK